MLHSRITPCLFAAVLLSGCVAPPIGPTAQVMPAPGKPFDVFAQDLATCKQFAGGEVSGGATLANLNDFGMAAMSTALGAGLGAATMHYQAQRGAELGGSAGAIAGMAIASRGAAQNQNGLQGRYDLAYIQCMYARGNQVASTAPAQSVTHNAAGRGGTSQSGDADGGYPGQGGPAYGGYSGQGGPAYGGYPGQAGPASGGYPRAWR
jgi:hypothetical protein